MASDTAGDATNGSDAETEITPEMIAAGAACLGEFLEAGGGLICTPAYVAEEVYRAMERGRQAGRLQDGC